MRGRSIVLVLLLIAASATPAGAQQEWVHPRDMGLADSAFVAPDPESLRYPLPGGAVAYISVDDLVPLVRFTALIGAGRADGAGAAGFAAGLRAGPASMSSSDFAELLAGMAALYEVEQGQTETRVTLEVPSEDVVLGLGLFAALLRGPLGAEAGDNSQDTASDRATGESGPVLYEGSLAAAVQLLEATLFADHPFGGAFDNDAASNAVAFRERFVVPQNVVLAVSGDFELATVHNALAVVFDGWSGEAPPLRQHPAPALPDARRVHAYDVDKLQGWVAIGHHLPEVPVQDEAALMVMNYIVGGGHFDTRLFRATRDRRGLTNDDSGFPEQGFRGPGVYTFRTYGRPQVVPLLIDLTFEEIDRIRAEPVSDEELFVARGALADGEYSLWFRNAAATTTTYAREWLRHRSHERSASWQDRVRQVTTADVLDAARRYLHPDRMQVVLVGPLEAIRSAPSLEGEPTLGDLEAAEH
jgi:zinc protease